MKTVRRGIKIGSLGAAAVLGTTTAFAADKDLLDILLQNGSINQAQYDTLMEKETVTKADLDEVKVTLNHKGLQFKTADENFEFALGGRLHAQAAYQDNDKIHFADGDIVDADDGTEIRRGRIDMKGVFYKDFTFKTVVDFADNDVAIKDMFLSYDGWDPVRFTVGSQKQHFSLEQWMSSNDMIFIERSLGHNSMEPDRAIGFVADTGGDNWTAALGAWGDSIDANKEDDEGWSAGGRVTYSPFNETGKVVHLGASGNYRVPEQNDQTARFRTETTRMSNLFLVDTDDIPDVDNIVFTGAEFAGVLGPFSVESEYLRTFVQRDAGGDLEFDSWYALAAWTLTGESRNYKGNKGKFGRLEPARNFDLHGGWGAWELAARYSQIDLNDGDINGGRESAIAVALNWYLNKNVRLMADYTRILQVDDGRFLTTGDDPEDMNILELRAQWAF
ncbi:MAG: porin [Pseudomonadota bacterium]